MCYHNDSTSLLSLQYRIIFEGQGLTPAEKKTVKDMPPPTKPSPSRRRGTACGG